MLCVRVLGLSATVRIAIAETITTITVTTTICRCNLLPPRRPWRRKPIPRCHLITFPISTLLMLVTFGALQEKGVCWSMSTTILTIVNMKYIEVKQVGYLQQLLSQSLICNHSVCLELELQSCSVCTLIREWCLRFRAFLEFI